MTSTVTAKGQTVVPKQLRDRFHIQPGTKFDWQEDGDSIRVTKVAPAPKTGFLAALRRLGRVPVAPRDTQPVDYE
jgi:AbrB family looped-hinge helix DNA binding protein